MNQTVLFIVTAVLAGAMAIPAPAAATEGPTSPPGFVQIGAPGASDPATAADGVAVVSNGVVGEHEAGNEAAAALEAAQASTDRRLAGIVERIRAATPGTAEIDAIDADLVAVLEQEGAALAEALDRLDRTAGAADLDLQWRTVDLHGKAMLRIALLRKEAAASFSEEHHRALVSFGREGLRQAAREARTAWLLVRYHLESRRHSLDELPQMTRDLFGVGAVLTRLFMLITILTAALWARRRWPRWLERLRTSAFRSLSSVAAKRRTQWLARWAETVAPWGLFLISLLAVRWALGPAAAAATEVNALLTILAVFGMYRLVSDVVAAVLVNVAAHYGLDTTVDRRAMLLRSVRTVLRVATILVLITMVSRALAQGFLGTLVTKFSWIVIAVAVLVELFRWRGVMVDTFLKLQPTGRLATGLTTTRSHWYGAFIAPAAFVWLAGRGIATVTREFALGFEETQRALAFLFRRRVQRQAEITGYAEGDVAELPAALVEAFREEALQSGPLVIANFPGMRELHEILSHWRDTGTRGSFLLTGERGVGKTTWLNQVRRDDLEIRRIVLGRRVTDPADLCARLCERLDVDVGPDGGLGELGRALGNGPKKVVVLDMGQHLFLSSVGGYEAFKAFAVLVNRTCSNVFWLCSMSAFAWRHLRAVRPDSKVFRTHRHLAGWGEDKITDLIRARCAACGVRFNFADLVVDRLEGVSVRSSLVESAEGYSRLLWDYSDGNPRAALHFFLRSLDPGHSNTVRVRLFKAPDVALLEQGGEDELFVLAAIVTHESIGLDDVVTVTRLERAQCFIYLDRLLEIGAVTLENEMYRVSATWHRAGVRLLRRRNLLPE